MIQAPEQRLHPMFSDPDLAGRVALVTGGGAGIGRAVAHALASRGADVWITGRRSGPLEQSAAEATPGRVRCCVLDASDSKGAAGLARRIEEEHGALHILVNNAAILGPIGPLTATGLGDVGAVWSVNIHGLYVTTAIMLPLLREGARGSGGGAGPAASVINVSSGVGRQGRAGWGPYAASKFAVEGLTQCWAEEFASDGIAVNALNPGATATVMRATAKPSEDPATLPRPEDIVPAFLYLLSEEAREGQITGTSIDARDFLASGD